VLESSRPSGLSGSGRGGRASFEAQDKRRAVRLQAALTTANFRCDRLPVARRGPSRSAAPFWRFGSQNSWRPGNPVAGAARVQSRFSPAAAALAARISRRSTSHFTRTPARTGCWPGKSQGPSQPRAADPQEQRPRGVTRALLMVAAKGDAWKRLPPGDPVGPGLVGGWLHPHAAQGLHQTRGMRARIASIVG